MKTKTQIWNFFNDAKVVAVEKLNFNTEQLKNLKAECDDLFFQATGCPICPGWYIGGF
jgi:hypothetical protein